MSGNEIRLSNNKRIPETEHPMYPTIKPRVTWPSRLSRLPAGRILPDPRLDGYVLSQPSLGNTISRIVAFGDSLSDTGNVFAEHGNPEPPYFRGRYTDGPVWLEQLARMLNVSAPTPSCTGGSNYAWGGATTGSGLSPRGVPNMFLQVEHCLARHTFEPTDLLTVWGGGNDFGFGQRNPAVPVANLVAVITELAKAGGRQFFVPNQFPLDRLPLARDRRFLVKQLMKRITRQFNSLLAQALCKVEVELGVTIYRLDLMAMVNEIETNPKGFGFTNVTGVALEHGIAGGGGYMFFDDLHPSARSHWIIGARAFMALQEHERFTLNVPAYQTPCAA
jgi:phospholipase/lecithinase/hemolysin